MLDLPDTARLNIPERCVWYRGFLELFEDLSASSEFEGQGW